MVYPQQKPHTTSTQGWGDPWLLTISMTNIVDLGQTVTHVKNHRALGLHPTHLRWGG